ncbi:hypothetical protein HK102_009457, partial [Quaeritorhiza haematococci]
MIKSTILSVSVALLMMMQNHVSAHGMLFAPVPVTPNDSGKVRGIQKLNNNIDSLRSPFSGNTICRGEGKGEVTPITLVNGQRHTVTMALSLGAQHVGPCSIEIRDADNLNAPGVVIATAGGRGAPGCANRPIVDFETDKSGPATSQCRGRIPKGSVTNDMCLFDWTFTVRNADQIRCTNCVMRWVWEGHHISPDAPEFYENCADVIVSTDGSAPSPGG